MTELNAAWARIRALYERAEAAGAGSPDDHNIMAKTEPVLQRIEAGMRELKAIAERAKGLKLPGESPFLGTRDMTLPLAEVRRLIAELDELAGITACC